MFHIRMTIYIFSKGGLYHAIQINTFKGIALKKRFILNEINKYF